MKPFDSLLPFGAVALLVAGCAAPARFAPLTSLPPDRPVAYFYGPTNGTFATCRIDYKGKRLTTINAGEYFAHQPQPGTNLYTVPAVGGGGLIGFMLDEPSASAIRVRLESAKAYYFKGIGVNTLMRVDEVMGTNEIATCRLAKPGDVPRDELPPPPVAAK
jgi:hypothetical protein